MKININKLKLIPNTIDTQFGFCVFGEVPEDILEWSNFWGFTLKNSGNYTNLYPNENFIPSEGFYESKVYQYIDGFSPNLNKHLHIGHASNLILANAFQHLNIGKIFIAILGDTLSGSVEKNEAYSKYLDLCKSVNYKINKVFFASEMKLKDESILVDGEYGYKGTKIFKVGDEKVVGIKSTGLTSYFYQDVALAQKLNASTLYLTGQEQDNHFGLLKKIYPEVDHISLGLVKLNGKKMSSSEGNVIFLQDFIDLLLEKFNKDFKLVYNIIAGYILKSSPESSKSINLDLIENPKQSLGLYLSYTMAHIKSCGVKIVDIDNFKSKKLEFDYLKAKNNLSPNVLFNSLVDHCKYINKLYETHYIKDNPENLQLFSDLISDLNHGMRLLGLFEIEKV